MRGSTPAPGQDFLRYGGHTSCVALALDGAQPTLLLDAGTGVRQLGPLLAAPFDGALVLTHLHWDHTHGLPFSAELCAPDARLEVVVPTEPGETPLEALLPGFRPPAFPERVDALAAGWTFRAAAPEQRLGGSVVRTATVRHKGGRTVGIRVEHAGRSLAYLPDHDLAEPDPAAAELVRGADLLLHDAQYLASEIRPFRDFGHSTIERACAFADEARVGALVLTHHAPRRTDDELDAVAARFPRTPGGIPVSVARQGNAVAVE